VYGLEAIQAHNGWAMAITGAVIVMVGLSILSFIISQLHRIVALVDGRSNRKSKKKIDKDQTLTPESKPQRPPLSDLNGTMIRFQPLTQEIGHPFDLSALFQVFAQHDDPHPHLTIRSLREQGYLIPDGNGLFTWKHE
jgi:oxaloacetate decarboxylase gamma subunit